MRSTHPAIKDARNALEEELEALTKRISAARKPKRQYKTVEAERNQANYPSLASPSEHAEANARPKRNHKAGNLSESFREMEPTRATQKSEPKATRRNGLDRMVGTAGRMVRWVKALFRR